MKTEKEIVLSPNEVGSQDLETVMKEEAQKRALITQYIAHHMKSGTDYGTIKFGNKESKPSLFKPGSEKFLSLFKLVAQFDKDTDTWEMAGSESGVFAYKCRLLDSKKRMVGEGRGVSKLTEKVGWTINNAVKIAEKRAQIDAVLRTGALSDFFTQDLEDMVQAGNQYDQTPVKDSDVPTVTYDDHEVPKNKPWAKKPQVLTETETKVKELKKQIQKIADDTVQVPLEGKEAYVSWVKTQSGLDLNDQSTGNLEAILERLNFAK